MLGADIDDASPVEAGEVLSEQLENMMRVTDMPNGISEVGYDDTDIPDLADGAFMQQRLLGNAPCDVTLENLEQMYSEAIRYW